VPLPAEGNGQSRAAAGFANITLIAASYLPVVLAVIHVCEMVQNQAAFRTSGFRRRNVTSDGCETRKNEP
jgi:hypothetical protein